MVDYGRLTLVDCREVACRDEQWPTRVGVSGPDGAFRSVAPAGQGLDVSWWRGLPAAGLP